MLEKISGPEDLKKLPVGKLEELALEIRKNLVSTVAQNGGHLAANLGVVELTLALHYVFNAPVDRIIWDVGHQSYVHKMLTGRLERMETLRRHGGMSGFPKREESPFDAFNTGHSSTSVSAAVGMALGRNLAGQDYSVISVIGDGALTGGMAFEALNHAGHLELDLTVILNDNAMSISRNVGALSTYLGNLRTDPLYYKGKEDVEQALLRIPGIGTNLVKAAGRVKDIIKFMVVPGIFFEELGFTYIGPIDGHNLQDMIGVMQKARRAKGPVLVHVITQKGRGYGPAMRNPDTFHGVGPFDIATGKPYRAGTRTYTSVFGDFMVRKGAEDPRLVAVTAAMESGTGLGEFARRYPDRFFDVGICEEHAVTMAAGMACAGLKPVVAIYSTFLQRAYDQIVHDVCLQKLPVVFAVDRAGLVGEDGPTHHGVFDLSFLRHIPNITIMSPTNEDELNDMLFSALEYGGPVVVRYPRGAGEGVVVKDKPRLLPAGRGVVVREGENVCLVAVGRGLKAATEAAGILAGQGIKAAIINARFVKPLDESLLLAWTRRCGRLVTIEENALAGGFGSAVLELISDAGLECDLLRIGIPDDYVEQGDTETLLDKLGISGRGIAASVIKRWPGLKLQRAVVD